MLLICVIFVVFFLFFSLSGFVLFFSRVAVSFFWLKKRTEGEEKKYGFLWDCFGIVLRKKRKGRRKKSCENQDRPTCH